MYIMNPKPPSGRIRVRSRKSQQTTPLQSPQHWKDYRDKLSEEIKGLRSRMEEQRRGHSDWGLFWIGRHQHIYLPVVPGQAGGGSFKEKKYKSKKEFAYRMRARRPTSAMPKPFLSCERAFCRSMVVMFGALK